MNTKEILIANKRWSALLSLMKVGESHTILGLTDADVNTIRAIASRMVRVKELPYTFSVESANGKVRITAKEKL